jgi:hypothetical protein
MRRRQPPTTGYLTFQGGRIAGETCRYGSDPKHWRCERFHSPAPWPTRHKMTAGFPIVLTWCRRDDHLVVPNPKQAGGARSVLFRPFAPHDSEDIGRANVSPRPLFHLVSCPRLQRWAQTCSPTSSVCNRSWSARDWTSAVTSRSRRRQSIHEVQKPTRGS